MAGFGSNVSDTGYGWISSHIRQVNSNTKSLSQTSKLDWQLGTVKANKICFYYSNLLLFILLLLHQYQLSFPHIKMISLNTIITLMFCMEFTTWLLTSRKFYRIIKTSFSRLCLLFRPYLEAILKDYEAKKQQQ